MKKFLTVLLVIAVMFTFTVSSAFATEPATQKVGYTKLTTEDQLVTYQAMYLKGKYGITEAERTYVLDGLAQALTELNSGSTVFYGEKLYSFYAPEKKEMIAAVEQAITDVKAATTAAGMEDIIDTLEATAAKKQIGKYEGTATATGLVGNYYKNYKITLDPAKVEGEATNTDILFDQKAYVGKNLNSAVNAYFLEGYGYISATNLDSTSKTTILSWTNYEVAAARAWFLDNGYRTEEAVSAHIADFVAALAPVTAEWTTAMWKEWSALDARVTAVAKKYSEIPYKNAITAADLDTIEAIIADVTAFNEKYCVGSPYATLLGINNDWTETEQFNNAAGAAIDAYLNQYYNEVHAVPEAAKLTDADKATVIALYKKVDAMNYVYPYTRNAFLSVYFGGSRDNEINGSCVEDYENLAYAYNHFKSDDLAALTKLANGNNLEAATPAKGFTVLIETSKYDFDSKDANVAALTAARAAYDEFVANYGYYAGKTDLVLYEARILAAENNKTVAAGYKAEATADKTADALAALNNATIKVTTQAVGNGKIRVQAQINNAAFEDLAGYTIQYQFYKKTAKAVDYKAGKVRDVNYTTFTGLKAGTKYNFQCAVSVLDSKGNVVATRSYKGSTVGIRTAK